MTTEQLKVVLELHIKWLHCEPDGKRANLQDANLQDADLRGANLQDADLRGANLQDADLRGANLQDANLQDANLRGANLRGANLQDADLRGANLRGANLQDADHVPFIPMTCPDTGSFIGFKKARGFIVKLEITVDAKRCSATGRKCRCNKALVLEIQNIDGSVSDLKSVSSSYDRNFVYKVGEVVEEPNFNEDRWDECSAGIHFFINRQEAVEY